MHAGHILQVTCDARFVHLIVLIFNITFNLQSNIQVVVQVACRNKSFCGICVGCNLQAGILLELTEFRTTLNQLFNHSANTNPAQLS